MKRKLFLALLVLLPGGLLAAGGWRALRVWRRLLRAACYPEGD